MLFFFREGGAIFLGGGVAGQLGPFLIGRVMATISFFSSSFFQVDFFSFLAVGIVGFCGITISR